MKGNERPDIMVALRRMLDDLVADPEGIDGAVERVHSLFTRAHTPAPLLTPPRYRLPNERLSRTGRLIIHGDDGAHTYKVTVGYFDDGTLGEIFAAQEKEGATVGSLLDAVATAISIGLQYGIPWQVYAAKFARWRFPPSGPTEDEDTDLRTAASPLDYLVRWVSKRVTAEGIHVPTPGQ